MLMKEMLSTSNKTHIMRLIIPIVSYKECSKAENLHYAPQHIFRRLSIGIKDVSCSKRKTIFAQSLHLIRCSAF